MASTLTRLLIHITFSTKNRQAVIPIEIEEALYGYIGGVCRRMGSPLLAINGTADHVYMLVSSSKTTCLSGLMLNIKRDSSKFVKEVDARLAGFAWQDGYFAFSIGESAVETLRTYIAQQKEHHRAVEYKDEIRAFLEKCGMEWDERYVWT